MTTSRVLVVAVTWSAAAYFWLLPLIRPRGIYGWGHYGPSDLLVGMICLVIALVVSSRGRAASGSRTGRALGNVATALCATLLAATACDLAYVLGVRQIWRPPRKTDIWLDEDARDALPDDVLGFVRKPAIEWNGRAVAGGRWVHYRTDEHGFRNPPGIDRADVVFIGDSFTEAGPLPEEATFARRVEAASGLRAVNLGRSRYGPQQEEIVLERNGLAYRPRAVVWVLFEGNDLADARRFEEWQHDLVEPRNVISRYAQASPMLTAVRLTVRRGSDRPRRLRVPGGETEDVYLDYRYVPDASAREPLGFSETRRALQTGMEVCRSRGIALLVLLVPIKVRVLAPWIVFDGDADRELFLPDGRDTDERDFAHAVGAASRALGLPVIDTFPLLRERAAVDDRLIYATYPDSHLEVDGHAVLTDAIVAWLGATTARQQIASPLEHGRVDER